ncbi:MAG: Lrp/AsnC family transcriptional regulator [Vulcanimicrobiaceae bacterium]
MADSSEPDELDLRLLEALQRHARSTFADLGALVGLKAPAVHDRVKRLEARGFIRSYAALLEARKLGFGLVAFVSVYTTPESGYDAFHRSVAALPEILEIHSVAGEESYLLKVITRSTAHLDDLLTRMKAVPGIARTKTTVVLSTPFERDGIALASGRGEPAESERTGRSARPLRAVASKP